MSVVDAAGHEFGQRMMNRPIAPCLVTDPDARFFLDPPEAIQRAFGGRPWFHATDCHTVHRVGLFRGLGWHIGEYIRKQFTGRHADVSMVKVEARKRTADTTYDMMFVSVTHGEDHLDPPVYRVIDHRPGLTLDQLKPAYAEMLGEHAI